MASRPRRILLERKRRRLFRDSKPLIRPFTQDDLWVFWAAYNEGSFPDMPSGLEKNGVYDLILSGMAPYDSNQLIEDNNRRFSSGRGPVGIVLIKKVGAVIEPKVVFFKWATAINKLRSCARFFVKTSFDRQISACVVRCYEDSVNLFHRVKDRGVLFYVGKIVGGNPSGKGDEYVFSIRGKFGANGSKNASGTANSGSK